MSAYLVSLNPNDLNLSPSRIPFLYMHKFQVCSSIIRHLCTLLSGHPQKSGYHPSPYNWPSSHQTGYLEGPFSSCDGDSVTKIRKAHSYFLVVLEQISDGQWVWVERHSSGLDEHNRWKRLLGTHVRETQWTCSVDRSPMQFPKGTHQSFQTFHWPTMNMIISIVWLSTNDRYQRFVL